MKHKELLKKVSVFDTLHPKVPIGTIKNSPIEKFGRRLPSSDTAYKVTPLLMGKRTNMEEKKIEEVLRKAAREKGGIAVKLVSPGFNGMPDRLVLFPGGKIAFVETKATGRKPRSIQEARHRMLRDLGFKVYVPDTVEKAKEVIDEISST